MTATTALWVKNSKTVLTIERFIRFFHAITKWTIHEIFSVMYPVSEITVLIKTTFENEIAILIASAGLRIFTIFWFRVEECWSGNNLHKITKLIYRTSRKIKLSAIIERIPVITPPVFLTINGECRLWMVDAHDIISRGITFSPIEFSLITKCEASLLSTVRTQCGIWNIEFLPYKNRWYLWVEFDILICNRETCTTFFTNSIFYEMLSRWDRKHVTILEKRFRTQKKTHAYPIWVFFGFV